MSAHLPLDDTKPAEDGVLHDAQHLQTDGEQDAEDSNLAGTRPADAHERRCERGRRHSLAERTPRTRCQADKGVH